MKPEYKIISDLIEKNAKVLDVGCDDGTLMEFLKNNKKTNIRGLEISKSKVQECIAKGLTVIEGNAANPSNCLILCILFFLPVSILCCLLYTSPSPRDAIPSRMPSSA